MKQNDFKVVKKAYLPPKIHGHSIMVYGSPDGKAADFRTSCARFDSWEQHLFFRLKVRPKILSFHYTHQSIGKLTKHLKNNQWPVKYTRPIIKYLLSVFAYVVWGQLKVQYKFLAQNNLVCIYNVPNSLVIACQQLQCTYILPYNIYYNTRET